VTEILTEAGGVTGPGQPILRLVRTGRPEIRVDVNETNLGKLSEGQKAIITSEAFPGESFGASVRQIGARVDEVSGTVEVRLDPQKPPAWLRPGQTVSANIIISEGRERLSCADGGNNYRRSRRIFSCGRRQSRAAFGKKSARQAWTEPRF
jgi:multidrug resistance efflux pump